MAALHQHQRSASLSDLRAPSSLPPDPPSMCVIKYWSYIYVLRSGMPNQTHLSVRDSQHEPRTTNRLKRPPSQTCFTKFSQDAGRCSPCDRSPRCLQGSLHAGKLRKGDAGSLANLGRVPPILSNVGSGPPGHRYVPLCSILDLTKRILATGIMICIFFASEPIQW